MRVVVTGGAGFIGANLCRLLVERGADVIVIDDLSTGHAANLDGLRVSLRVASILDSDALNGACAGADSIVHLAALASVCAVSKLATEAYAAAYQTSYGLPTLAFRFFNVFGPLQPASHVYAAVVPAFISAAQAGQPLTIFGDGGQTRDFVYVGTVAALLAEAALTKRAHPAPVNLALGVRTSLNELIDLLEKVLGFRVERRYCPPRPGDIRDSRADNATLRALFPNLAPVDLESGLAQTVQWFRSLDHG